MEGESTSAESNVKVSGKQPLCRIFLFASYFSCSQKPHALPILISLFPRRNLDQTGKKPLVLAILTAYHLNFSTNSKHHSLS